MLHHKKHAILLKASELHHQQCDVMAGVVAIALYFGKVCMDWIDSKHKTKFHLMLTFQDHQCAPSNSSWCPVLSSGVVVVVVKPY